jgi:hypothetical protein
MVKLIGLRQGFIELLQSLFSHIGQNLMNNLRSKGLVLHEIRRVGLIVFLETPVKCKCTFVLSDLFPGCFYLGNCAIVHALNERFKHRYD